MCGYWLSDWSVTWPSLKFMKINKKKSSFHPPLLLDLCDSSTCNDLHFSALKVHNLYIFFYGTDYILFEADNLLGICIDFIQQKIREFVKLCRNKSFWNSKWNKFDGKSDFLSLVMFMYSEKAAKSYEISTLLLS